MGILEADFYEEKDPERLRREQVILDVARAAISESIRGFHFGQYEDDVQMLRRLHSRVQVLKNQGPLQGNNALNKAREERLNLARYIVELIVDTEQTVFPDALSAALARYRATSRPHTESSNESSSSFQDDLADHSDNHGEAEGGPAASGDRTGVRIHGLEAIPACGAPLPAIGMRKLPTTLYERAKDQVDNADYWYAENRRVAILVAGAVAFILLIANFIAIMYVSRFETDFVPPEHFVASAALNDAQAAASPGMATAPVLTTSGERSKNRTYLLIHVPVLALLAGLLAGVFFRSHLSRLEFSRRYSLRMVKAILVPVDVSVERSLRPFTSLRFHVESPSEGSQKPTTRLERRIRIAQVAAMALLASVLALPPVVQAVWQPEAGIMVEDAASGTSASTENISSEDSNEHFQNQVRAQYTRLTVILTFIILMLIVVYVMRRLHHASRSYIQGFDPVVSRTTASGGVPAEPKPWTREHSGADYAIDHENPDGAKAKKVADNAKEMTLAKQFKIEVMIGWYRFFNKWRILRFSVALLDNTLRFMGVIVFGALLLLSVVMPLFVLSIFQESGGASASGIQSLAREYFPEIYPEEMNEVGETSDPDAPAAQMENSAEDGRLTLEVRAAQHHEPGNPWALPYALVLAAIVMINLLLLGLRLLARKKARGHVTGTNWRLTAEISFSSLIIILALWLWDASPGYATTKDLNAEQHPLAYREPAVLTRVQRLTEEKIFTQFFLPESTFANIWHVDAKSPGPVHDGRSWDSAFRTLEEGVVAAALSGGGEIWVGQGSYRPILFSTDRDQSILVFGIPDDVHVFGGFAGAIDGGYETSRLERNWKTQPTVLDLRKADADNRAVCLWGSGRWTVDGLVVVGGGILGDSATSRLGRGPRLRGVVGNTRFLFPEEPIAYVLGGDGDDILFHHAFLIGSEGVSRLWLQTCSEYPGAWTMFPRASKQTLVQHFAPVRLDARQS